ncbi:Omega-amidase [Durusdinium trenchii]|uniref:Chloroplastic (Nitrilase-like protein 3) n=1 Tax=Durusdinium trenchii TaxID=1381693 RepID=A0ABP0KXV7_9DINO
MAWRIFAMKDSDFEALLDNMDLSRDGTIHWHEVMHSEGFDRLPKDVKKKFQKAFTKADRDEDLVLTMEEFKHFYRDTEPWVSSEVGTTCGEYNEFKLHVGPAWPLAQHLELGVYLTIPFVEEEVVEGDARFFNTVCLASPEGKIVIHYRKTFLWDYVDGSWATRGELPGTFDTEFGRVGIGICYDIHRLANLYGPWKLWALLYSVAWVGHQTDGPVERWFRKDLPETYLGNGGLECYVVAANWSTEREYSWDGAGYSSIYGPDGQRMGYLDLEVGDSILYQDLPCGRVH